LTIPNTVDSPSPVPLPGSFVVKKGSNARLGLRVHPDASVGNHEEHVWPRREDGVQGSEVLVHIQVAGFHDNLAPLRHRIARIHDQVHDDLLQRSRVALHRAQGWSADETQGYVLPEKAAQYLVHSAEELAQIDHFELQYLLSAEEEELAREIGGSTRGFAHLFDVGAHRVFRIKVAQDELAVAQNYREGIVELVSNSSGEPTYRFHFLGVAQLNLTLLVRLLGARSFGLERSASIAFAKLPLDDRGKLADLFFGDEVLRSCTHRKDRGLFARASRHDDERDVQPHPLHSGERVERAEPWEGPLGDHDVRAPSLERVVERCRPIDSLVSDVSAAATELLDDKLGVNLGVVDDEHA
jgi:hypothetical protein